MTFIHDREYGRQLVSLLRRLTEIDGEVNVLEKRWLRTLMEELQPNDDTAAEAADFDPQRLKVLVEADGEAEELIELLLLVSLADGETSAEEWELISSTAKLVGVSAARLEELRTSTILTIEPT